MTLRNSKTFLFATVLALVGQLAAGQTFAPRHHLATSASSGAAVLQANASEADVTEVSALLEALKGNRFGLVEEDLTILENPDGTGYFIYVERVSFGGTQRQFAWFANSGIVSALNGASKNATPGLPFPREASDQHLAGTGHDPINITSYAMKLLF